MACALGDPGLGTRGQGPGPGAGDPGPAVDLGPAVDPGPEGTAGAALQTNDAEGLQTGAYSAFVLRRESLKRKMTDFLKIKSLKCP